VKHIIDHDIPAQVADKGAYLIQRLRGLEDRFPFVTEVRGKGLLTAIQFDQEMSERVVGACLEKGLIVNNVRPDAARLAPPLTVTQEEIDRALAILEGVLEGMDAPVK
jgi:acetylornithine/N-succinyldiaminopimelate aminotransferase